MKKLTVVKLDVGFFTVLKIVVAVTLAQVVMALGAVAIALGTPVVSGYLMGLLGS